MHKSNKTDEIQVVAGDNRIRRLIPSSAYAAHFNQNSDFNYYPMVSAHTSELKCKWKFWKLSL